MQSYFKAPNFPDNMVAIWKKHFGYLVQGGYAIAVGEFAGKYGEGDARDVTWQNALVDYLRSQGITDSFVWS